MHRLLFTAHPSVGHTNALSAIALKAMSRGHAARVLLSAGPLPAWLHPALPEPLRVASGLPAALDRLGLPVEWLTPPPSALWHGLLLPRERGYGELRRALKMFTADLVGSAREIARRISGPRRVDAVVSDYTFLAAWLGAELAGVPFVAVYHSGLPFAAEGAAPFGSGLGPDASPEALAHATGELQSLARWLNETVAPARRTLGLRPAEWAISRPYDAALNLLTTHPALELPRAPLGDNTLFVGPCLGARAPDADFPRELFAPGPLRVYVSLGTVFNERPEVFREILRALDDVAAKRPLRVIVSAGASFEALSRPKASAHVHLFRRVPQLEVLRASELVVSHGGNNTVNETLAAGVPLVVLPFGGEQVDNAARVEALGAGVFLRSAARGEVPTRDELSGAIERVLSTASMSARAAQIRDALVGVDGAAASVDAIERLLATPR